MRAEPSLPLTDKPGVGNWVEKYHALPKGSWIRRAAEHIHAKGHPTGTSIAFAVNAARRLCKSGDLNFKGVQQASLGSRADACAAVAVWDAARAKAKASKDLSADEWFHTVDLAGARLARGLDLTEHQAEVIDLAFDPDKHPRDPVGRFAAIIAALKKSEDVELPDGTRVIRSPSPEEKFYIHGANGTGPTTASTPEAAARRALDVSAQTEHPQAVGGTTTYASFASATKASGAPSKRLDRVRSRRAESLPKRINSPAMTLSSERQQRVVDLAETKRMNGLYDVAATVKRLRKNPKLKNLTDSEIERIAVARILRRRLRNKLGITDLKKLSPKQQAALKKAGLVGGGKSAVGTVVSYTLQRGPRKGQTISIKRTAAGWHEVKAR